MSLMWLVAMQFIALLGVIELFVRMMPTALRRASEQNCYRVDGTRSEHRTYRERRARNRLRRDMLAVLVLVFLTGNALYFTVDNVAPVGNVATRLWNGVFGSPSDPLVANHQNLVMSADQKDKLVSDEQINRLWPLLVAGIALWATFCFVLVGFGAFRAYRSFSEGVHARSAEHFHLDMTRMSVADSQFIGDAPRTKDSNQGVA